MDDGRFDDPVLELARRIGDYPGGVLEFAGVSDAEARQTIEALDEADAEEAASSIVGRLRHQWHEKTTAAARHREREAVMSHAPSRITSADMAVIGADVAEVARDSRGDAGGRWFSADSGSWSA